jgi:3-oxoacyl-[acyl-carrier protein] reductase
MRGTISLEGRAAVITGAKQGIGAGVAIGFARRGARVALWDIAPEEDAEETLRKVREHCPDALYVQVDVVDPEAAKAAARATLERFGQVDILVNNAGIYPTVPFLEMSFEEWRRVVDVSLCGSWACAKAVVPDMVRRGYGKIINVSSIQFLLASPDLSHYVSAKAGVLGLTRALARELGKHGIRVNSVMPGAIRTESELRHFPEQQELERVLNEKQCLPGRIGPEDIEPTFAFLAAPESDPITGQAINVDHGWVFW